MPSTEERPYLNWDPYFDLETIFSESISLYYPSSENTLLYWLESRPEENGRITLVKYDPATNTKEELIPSPYYLRSRVHEYGGRPYTIHEGTIYFVNFTDQRLYKYHPQHDSSPVPLTPEKNTDGSIGKYAVPLVIMNGKFLVFVYEREYSDKENINALAYLPLLPNASIREPFILCEGNDFYGDPVFYESGNKLAYLTWNHPFMPWDYTELWEGELHVTDQNQLRLVKQRKIKGGNGEAICTPCYNAQGVLYFVMDEPNHENHDYRNWWNIYSARDSNVTPLTHDLVEYGFPMWVLGVTGLIPFQNGRILAIKHEFEKDDLVLISGENDVLTLNTGFTYVSDLTKISEETIAFIGHSTVTPSSLVLLNITSRTITVIQKETSLTVNSDAISIPQFIEFPTEDGELAYGFYYPPKNPKYCAPKDDKPPLLMMVHGGPTGKAIPRFSLSLQYFTSQGFAVFNIDHRGSSGYGRKYRDKLLGNWGIIDMEDIAHAITFLQHQGYISEQAVIRGGSAGGYAVQRALTMYPNLFTAGASYFGIGNLETLAKFTHKFESRYLDRLLGASFKENPNVYKDRSPINHLNHLESPMILFQGLEDKVVPPTVSQEIAYALKQKGIYYEYVEYEGEAHGFRKKETNIDALARESKFFKAILARGIK